jgi:phosphinothricin acetyltransferase
MITSRAAVPSDARAIAEIYNEAVRTTTATFDTVERTQADRLAWLQSHDERHPILVAQRNGKVVGWASLSQWSDRQAYADTAETSFYVKEEFRGRGIGRRLKEELLKAGRQAGLHTVIARVSQGNEISIHLNESCGFRHIGVMREVGRKFGKLLDVHLMQYIYPE